jgi:hypothetical protein
MLSYCVIHCLLAFYEFEVQLAIFPLHKYDSVLRDKTVLLFVALFVIILCGLQADIEFIFAHSEVYVLVVVEVRV